MTLAAYYEERERLFAELIAPYLTPVQAAHVLEQWEAIVAELEQRRRCLSPALAARAA